MSRPLRIEFAEAVYHIMARGNQGLVARRWIAENLMMGYESGVSRAVSFVESSAANKAMTMKSKLRNADGS
jgi:hypothetical protein